MSDNLENSIYNFSADIKQLLNLIINAFYSNKEIFLRELISNSSDALEKLRTLNLTANNSNSQELEIKLIPNLDDNLLTIVDNGIGMNEKELIDNLGTIAKSGTKIFMNSIKNENDNFIGQFGVGFYSSFLVADKVEVISRSSVNEEYYSWSCDGDTSFKVNKYSSKTDYLPETGTMVKLFLKKECTEFTKEEILINLVKKYSDYIKYPIKLLKKKFIDQEPQKDKTDDQKDEKTDDPSEPPVAIETYVFETVNTMLPIWALHKDQIKQEQYDYFFKSLNTGDKYLTHRHISVEGDINYKALLFIPENMSETYEKEDRIKIYSKHVFVTDNKGNFLPEYLNCFVGIIDIENLQLNASRELLQNSSNIELIYKSLTKKCLDAIYEISKDETVYAKFYEKYSKALRAGAYFDRENRERIFKLLRFYSVLKKAYISLDDYIANAQNNQGDIYYLCGEKISQLLSSPFIHSFTRRNIDVLLLDNPLDEQNFEISKFYENKYFKSLTKDSLSFDESGEKLKDEKHEKPSDTSDNENKQDKVDSIALCTAIKLVLGNKIEKVVLSKRLETIPCCITNSKEWGWTPQMEKMMSFHDVQEISKNFLKPSRNLEININHKLMIFLYRTRDNKELFERYVNCLYDLACLSSGFSLYNSVQAGNNMFNLITELTDNQTIQVQEIVYQQNISQINHNSQSYECDENGCKVIYQENKNYREHSEDEDNDLNKEIEDELNMN